MKEAHSLLEGEVKQETSRADAAERETTANEKARLVIQAALTAVREEMSAAKAQALAAKEKVTDTLTALNRETSATLALVVRENTAKREVEKTKQEGMAAEMWELQGNIEQLQREVADEKRRADDAEMTMQDAKKNQDQLVRRFRLHATFPS